MATFRAGHVGTGHHITLGGVRPQLRGCTPDPRAAGVTFPCDRTPPAHLGPWPAPPALSRRTHRLVTRPLPATAAADAGGAADGGSDDAAAAAADADAPAPPKKSSSLAKRAVFGTILGLGGAVVILVGDWLYAAAACLVAFQCSKEYVGLVNAKGMSAGMKPPPPIVSSVISLLCVALNAWAFVSGGKTASAMAVATFMVLSLQLVASDKPRFSQLTSAVFGLVYCGE